MNDNIGKNICLTAKIFAWIYAIAGAAAAIALWAIRQGFLMGLIPLAAAAVMIFATCWPLYGFGRMVQDVRSLCTKSGTRFAAEDAADDELPDL